MGCISLPCSPGANGEIPARDGPGHLLVIHRYQLPSMLPSPISPGATKALCDDRVLTVLPIVVAGLGLSLALCGEIGRDRARSDVRIAADLAFADIRQGGAHLVRSGRLRESLISTKVPAWKTREGTGSRAEGNRKGPIRRASPTWA